MLENNVNIEKRSTVKNTLIKAGIIGAGVIGLSGIVSSAPSIFWRDADGTLTDLKGTSSPGGAGAEKIGISVGNGSVELITGLQGGYFTIPFSGTITGFYLASNQVGSIVFDVWKTNASIPTITNTITASAKPTLSSAQLATNTTLTGWTTSVTTGDIIAYNIDSVTGITFATLVLYITKS